MEPNPSKSSSAQEIVSFLKSSSEKTVFPKVQEILTGQHNYFKNELENLKKSQEDQLKRYMRKCEQLTENVARLKEDKMGLEHRVKQVEERYKKIIEDHVKEKEEKVGVLLDRIDELKDEKKEADRVYKKELNDRVSRLEKGLVGKSLSPDDVAVIRKWSLDQDKTRIQASSSNGIVTDKSCLGDTPSSSHHPMEAEPPLPINVASENEDHPLTCEARDNNIDAVSDKPSLVILSSDDEDMATNETSNNCGLGGVKGLASSHKKRRAVGEVENNDSSSSSGGRKTKFIRPCESKVQLPPLGSRVNYVGANDSGTEDSCSTQNMDMLF